MKSNFRIIIMGERIGSLIALGNTEEIQAMKEFDRVRRKYSRGHYLAFFEIDSDIGAVPLDMYGPNGSRLRHVSEFPKGFPLAS